jgi:hypothetical protein
MISGNSLFDLLATFSLWGLSALGGIPVLLSWIFVEREYDEHGILTRGSRSLIWARALLTVGCTVFWICALLEQALPRSGRPIDFGFWQNHQVQLVILFFVADLLLISSAFFARQARGSGGWILWISTPIVTVASIAASFVLYMSAFSA